MEIILFIVGFVTGTICCVTIFMLINKNLKVQFENTANRIFKESSQEFSNINKEKLDEIFIKFKERIEDFEKRNEDNFRKEQDRFTIFDTNIKTFIEEGNKISQNTNSLVNIMKSDNRAQGHWGEVVLERVLESSGLRRDEEFVIQKGATVEGRPDAIVFLPEKKCVPIDAKTSLASWSKYLEARTDEERAIALKAFSDSTKNHIAGLAKRNYAPVDDYCATDYILMFMPIESCYSLLFCNDNALWDYAWKNNIMPVSPSTLLAALKIINSFLIVDRQNKNALEISRLCSKMLDKFADAVKDIIDARKKISSALKKFDGRDSIITNIDKITNLGVKMNKQIPEISDDLIESER